MTFPQRANILRLFVGQMAAVAGTEFVALLETNVDDVTAETIGYTRDRLMQAGAHDVYTTSVQMKKDRPGTIISVLCRTKDRDRMESILFEETGTLGIRRQLLERNIQHRDHVQVTTPWGEVAGKRSWRTGHSPRFAPEFEDCARLAREHSIPLRDVYLAAESAFLKLEESDKLPLDGAAGTTSPDGHHHDHSHDAHDHDHDHDHDHHH